MRRIIAVLALVAALPLFAQQPQAAAHPTTPQPAPATAAQPAPPPVTPDQLWNALLQSNKQFAAGKIAYDDLDKERAQFLNFQAPPVTILSCSDSRVPPELVFHQSLGVLFVVRSAGNVADDFGIASIEYAILHKYTKLIVVLGHQNCGAVASALEPADPVTPSLLDLVTRIRSSFVNIPYEQASLPRAIEANARASAAQLLAKSHVIRDAVVSKQVKVVAAYYDFNTGLVRALD
ncbi:MAG: carbonic anhydrase [Acidobacteria bacterium]|nr:carbonic anhydrase [Acidobacteriota bacterium]MBV9474455.1 carbonic anhydrase [Acidobacteriota bacterium]